MSFSTSVPAPTFGPTGFIAPADSAILAGVQADLNAAFGGDLNPALSTPQGQLASSNAAIISAAYALFLFYSTQSDPAFAQGRMQDGIARIYFLARNPAQPTVVQALCTGLVGTPIPTGALAKAADGNTYVCTAGGTIPGSGNITLPFACLVTGPIVCPAGALNTIYRTVPGWDSIGNIAPGVVGNAVESPAAFEQRRGLSVALNSRNTTSAILAVVLAVPNVLDAYVVDNPTGMTTIISGVPLAPHSVYVAAAGGAAQAVANAIWSKKPPGCAYNGNTTLTVVDTNSGYSLPYPSYSVTYQTPTPLTIFFAVSIANIAAVPSTATAQIQAAILAAFSGADGGVRARIGATIFASRFYAGIALLGAWAEIVSLQIGTVSGNANTVTVDIDQVPVTAADNITVTLV
jgi:hypothetical protein